VALRNHGSPSPPCPKSRYRWLRLASKHSPRRTLSDDDLDCCHPGAVAEDVTISGTTMRIRLGTAPIAFLTLAATGTVIAELTGDHTACSKIMRG
jgi:hypothetical protein